MNVDRKVMIAAMCLTAASLTACKKSTTAPFDPRTVTVVAPPVTLPATPTTSATIATNDPNSHVAVTLPVGVQQQINALVGGAATVSMSDVAPPDFGTLLPAGDAGLIGSRPLTVLLFTVAKAGSVAAADLNASGPNGISADASTSTISFSITLGTGITCQTAPLLFLIGNSSIALNGSITYTAGPPATISGTTSALAFTQLKTVIVFECPSATVTGGTSGAN
jgi:hypothetical protein